jgi:hypothetical protein
MLPNSYCACRRRIPSAAWRSSAERISLMPGRLNHSLPHPQCTGTGGVALGEADFRYVPKIRDSE